MRGTLHRQTLVLICVALVASAVMLAPLPVRAASPVANCNDSGAGSLRDAITTATSGATITFQAGLNCSNTGSGPITLTGGTLTLTQNVTIDGIGAMIVVDGNNNGSVFTVNSGVTASINLLTIQHGNATNGGGINNSGTLTVTNSTLSANNASVAGGAVQNSGTLTLTGSTLSANNAFRGGGIENNPGTLTLTNTTFSGNAASFGGGIYTFCGNGCGALTATATNSTFSGNSGSNVGGGIEVSSGSMLLTNTIVANSTAGGDCFSFGQPTLIADSHNLADDGSCGGATVATSAQINLQPLASNGGPTQTMALGLGSVAIDQGAAVGSGHPGPTPPANTVPATDQRGVARVNAPDIGAFEAHFILASLSGGNQSTVVGTPFPGPLVVAVTGLLGEPIPNAMITFVAPASGASGTFTGNGNTVSVLTNASGIATTPTFTANATAGGYTVTASAGGVATPASFALTNIPVPASIMASAGTPQQATVYTPFATPLAVTVTDGGGNPVPGVSITFTAPATGASGYFAVSPVVSTDQSGIATAPLFIANGIAGSYSVTANLTAAPLGTPATFALTNAVGASSSLTPGTGTSPQSAHVTAAFPVSLSVTASDAQHNPIPGLPITFTAPAIGPSGTFANNGVTVTVQTDSSGVATAPAFTANTVAGGPYSVIASDGIGHITYFALTNTLSAPTITNVSPASGSTDGGGTVTITGTVFLSGATVKFGNTAATNVVVVNATTITATVPAHAAGAVAVVVTNTDLGNATLAGGYTYGVVNPLPGGKTLVPAGGLPPNPMPPPRP